jgi:hypothetical protein
MYSNILSFNNNVNKEFIINGTNSTSIFEKATITGITENNPMKLKIANNVTNISRGFMDCNVVVLDIELLSTNNISDLSYFLSGANSTIRISNL